MSGNESLTIEKIQEEIRNKNARWAPKQERRLSLSAEEIRYSLGVRKDERSLEALRTRRDVLNINDLAREFGKSRQLAPRPQSIDWRNANGKNCVTSIKDQKGCGSCVAFGIASALESMVIIEHNKQYDLSEAELFFCAGPDPVLVLVPTVDGGQKMQCHIYSKRDYLKKALSLPRW